MTRNLENNIMQAALWELDIGRESPKRHSNLSYTGICL